MAKTAKQNPNPPDAPVAADGWPPWQRVVVSVVLVIHLAGVISPPLNFATMGSGPARWFYQTLRPYCQAAYLDHGYFFFAPDPGASHLVRFRAQFEDDREPMVEMFPDKKKQWPRLLYHRHFMLTEHLHAAYAPPEPPPGLDDRGLSEWRAARDIYESRWNGFEQHLKTKYRAKEIRLTRVEHRPPDPLEFLDGRALDDEQLYIDLPENPPANNGAGQGGNGPPLLPNGPLRPGVTNPNDQRPPPFLERLEQPPAPQGPIRAPQGPTP